MKDSFVFRKVWSDAISELPDNIRLEIYEAIIEYGTTGNISKELKQVANALFKIAKATLDEDAEREMEISEKRRKAGNIGNAKRWNKNNESVANAITESQNSQMRPNAIFAIPEIEKENEKDVPMVSSPTPLSSLPLEKEKEKDRESLDFSEQKFADMRKLFDKRKAKFIESVEPYVAIYGKEMTDAFISYWTEPNKSHTKMRHELERTWDVSRRLSTWASRDRSHEAPMARAKRVVEEQARKAREERQSSTDELMRKRDQWTKQAVSLEEARNSEEYKRAMAEA